MKVISFSQQGPQAICILSANGVISSVTLRQPDSSGGTLTYEVSHPRMILVPSPKIPNNTYKISHCYVNPEVLIGPTVPQLMLYFGCRDASSCCLYLDPSCPQKIAEQEVYQVE
jgi:hypothetical protein